MAVDGISDLDYDISFARDFNPVSSWNGRYVEEWNGRPELRKDVSLCMASCSRNFPEQEVKISTHRNPDGGFGAEISWKGSPGEKKSAGNENKSEHSKPKNEPSDKKL